jgi:uncharacterized damage-inducible protein DinB
VAADAEFIEFSAGKMQQLCGRIEDCLGRLTCDQVWMRNSGNENAVGNLVLHLCGNVTQWIGSGVAGRPDHRERNKEFAARGDVQSAELAMRIHAVIEDAAAVIRSLTSTRLAERTSVQGFDLTILEAVYHVVEHFSMHTGQILFATKLLTGQDLGCYHDLAALARTETVP